ncbi:MAG: T9SS type A sorting domain-containing protein [Lewinellaceae bacterium]|nr:T9SS type A sorting domain-containing protein [Lewinellaceae bacterium]
MKNSNIGACRRGADESRTGKYYSERGAKRAHSGATQLTSNEVQNNICRSQAIKCFSDRLLVLFLLFCSFGLSAQVSHWDSYGVPGRAQNRLEEGNTLWIPTDAGLLEVDKATGEYSLWNKLTGGLSSNSIEAVARHPLTGDLFIGTYDVALLVRDESTGAWSPLPYPEAWEASVAQPVLTYCLQFDPEGILWAGTNIGLARYDGESWELYNQENSHEFLRWVMAIELAPDGGLFLASHVLFHLKDGVFDPLSPDDFQSEEFIFSYGDAAMHYQSDGSLWFFTDVGTVGRYDGENWQIFQQIDSLNFVSSPPRFVTESPDGNLLAYFGGDDWYQFADGAWSVVAAPNTIEQPFYFAFLEEGNITVGKEKWMVETAQGAYAASFPEYPFSSPLFYFNHDPQGQLWVKEGASLRNLDTGESLSLEGEGTPLYFSSYAFSEQGDLWAAQHGAVFHLTDEGWKRFDHTNTLLPNATNSWQIAIGEDNTVWLSIYNQGLYSYQNGDWKRHLHPTLSAFNISEMIPLPDGKLWLRLWSSGNPFRFAYWDGENVNLISDGEQGFRQASLQLLSYDPASGLLWALDWEGLQQFDGEAWEQLAFPFERETNVYENIYTFSVRDERILISTNLRIFIYENGQWFSYSADTAPLANEDIREVAVSQDARLYVLHQGTPFVEVGQLSVASAADGPDGANFNIKVHVYPNPVSDKIFLAGVPGSGRGIIHLFDAAGRLAGKTQAHFTPGEPAEITMLNLAPGWYTGRVYLEGEGYVFRLLKGN